MKERRDIAETVSRATDRIRSRTPAFNNILESFTELIVERACLKERLALPDNVCEFHPDSVRFSQGVPLMSGKKPEFQEQDYLNAAESLLPAMEKGFPKIIPDICAVKDAMRNRRLSIEQLIQAVLNGEGETVEKIGRDLDVEPQLLRFVIGQIMKPFMEKQEEALRPVVRTLQWHKGICPVCGSLPEFSLLKGETGERWLRCSVCAHEWRFIRTQCPVCENEDANQTELVFFEDHPYERVELCHLCKKYLIGFDLRKYPEEMVYDVAGLGALVLDIVAQERGYVPMTDRGWNVVD